MSADVLTGGTYNAVTRVTFEDGTVWVVKIPPAHGTGLSYEQRLLNEVTFYAAAAGDAMIPQVVHGELAPEAPGGAYVLTGTVPRGAGPEASAGTWKAVAPRLVAALEAL